MVALKLVLGLQVLDVLELFNAFFEQAIIKKVNAIKKIILLDFAFTRITIFRKLL